MESKIQQIKKLRDETGMGLGYAKDAFEEANGDYDKAKQILKEGGSRRIRPDRKTNYGAIVPYIHGDKVGSLVELTCETDFVAKTSEFRNLAREIAMQVTAMNPETIVALLEQDYIRKPGTKVSDLITDYVVQCGENIKVNRFTRFELNEDK